jgi:hypothetical protein
MPRLPDATDLTGSAIAPARSFVNLPSIDIAGAANALAQGVGQVGASIEGVRKDREEKFRKQERFDTKMNLLKAEEIFAEQTRDLDPLDPAYVEKKKAVRRDVFGPVLSNVKDPENRMFFDESTGVDYANISIKAADEHQAARKQKQALDLTGYVDGIRKRVLDGTYEGDAVADVNQMLDDAGFDEVTTETLRPQLLKGLNDDLFEVDFQTIASGGVSVTPSVKAAVTKAVATAGPDAPSYLGDFLLRLAMVESRGGRAKVNPRNPEVGGSFQIHTNTAPELGLSNEDRFDDEKSAVGTVKKVMKDYRNLKAKLGREPTPAELYLPWQQGSSGGPKLLENPDKKAVDVVGRQAVLQNLTDKDQHLADKLTAGQFAEYVMRRFDGTTGGMVDAEDTLETLRLTDSYQRMGPEEQKAAEKSVLSWAEKQNKDVAENNELNTARDYANAAASEATSLAEGFRWIDENIPDPKVREKARTMFKTDFEANEKVRDADYKNRKNEVTMNVLNAVNQGNTDEALRVAYTSGLEADDVDKLADRVAKGRVEIDNPRVLDRLRYLKYGTDAQKQEFLDMDLREYAGDLKQSTFDSLIEEQNKLKEQFAKTGKVPSLVAPSKLLEETYDLMKLDVSDKVSSTTRQTNEQTRQRLAGIFETNVQIATNNLGRDLQPEELRRVRDETIMEFTRKETKDGWTKDYEVAVQQGLADIFTLFDETEAKRNAEIETLNQKNIEEGKPVIQQIPPGGLLRQAQEALASFHAAEKARVEREIRAIERGERRAVGAVQDRGLEESYRRLQRQKRRLDTYEINAQELYLWLVDNDNERYRR